MTISDSRPLFSPSLPSANVTETTFKEEQQQNKLNTIKREELYSTHHIALSQAPTSYFNEELYENSRRHQKMLATHPRLPVHLEYLQPHITATESTKASPLALLAATCSSIGRTDAEKKESKTTTTSPSTINKLSPSSTKQQQDVKKSVVSSFKPYRLDSNSISPPPKGVNNNNNMKQHRSTPPSSVMRSSPPVLVSNTNIVSSKASSSSPSSSSSKPISPIRIGSIGRPMMSSSENHSHHKISPSMISPSAKRDMIEEYAKYHEKLSRDLKCHSVSPPLPHLPPSHKLGGLPGSHHPHAHPHHPYHPQHGHNHTEFMQCKSSSGPGTTKRRSPHSLHNDIMSSVRSSTLPPPCSCQMCRSGGDAKCHTPGHPALGMYHQSSLHKGLPPPPPPSASMPCRDPGCTNCSKPKNLQNFVHPALVHQCTHSKSAGPYPPPPHPTGPYDPYFMKSGFVGQAPPPSVHSRPPKPYICNWVFEGKHCGGNFVTSEELYQHLRTHTSLQQQRTNETESRTGISPLNTHGHGTIPSPTQQQQVGSCNIHGCPCQGGSAQRKSPRTMMPGYPPYAGGVSASSRYTPYGRPVSAGGNTLPGHFPGSHGMYHY